MHLNLLRWIIDKKAVLSQGNRAMSRVIYPTPYYPIWNFVNLGDPVVADRGLFATCASVLVAAVGCLDHVKIMTDWLIDWLIDWHSSEAL